ncbi:MAG: hypothetical protein HY791_02875 [Deltaproteobacteria bacterium]|nr:hypothetical protein [Deltaproteobacteria bacterium]
MTLYDRRARVLVGPRLFEFPGLRISFKVTRQFGQTANTAEVIVHNLSEASRGAVMRADKPEFVIEAGYASGFGALFTGKALRVTTHRETIGIATKFDSTDGSEEMQKTVSKTYAPGTKVGKVLADLAGGMNINAANAIKRALSGDLSGAVDTFREGVTVAGKIGDEFDRILIALGAAWSVENGELVVLKAGESVDSALVLGPATGLIGSPERFFDAKHRKVYMVKGQAVLSSRIFPGRRVELNTQETRGSFLVTKTEHSGDTHGPEWSTSFESMRL